MIAARSASDDAQLAPAFAAAQQICRREARDFYFASFFLPPHKRRSAFAVGAFCRMVVDALDVPAQQPLAGATAMREHPAVVSPARSLPVIQPQGDSHCDVDTPASRMDMLRDRLDEIYAGQLELPSPEARSLQQHALYAFAETVRRYEIPRQHFLELAEGCRLDQITSRYETWTQLRQHCARTGGAATMALSGVLGLTHSDVRGSMIALGSALRLTSILRDVKRGRDRGRIYLPHEELDRFGYSTEMLSRGQVNESFRQLMQLQIDRARGLYREGAESLCWLAGDGSRLAGSLAAVAQARILDEIQRRRYDVFSTRIQVRMMQKLACLPRAVRLARRRHDRPLPDVFGP